MPLGRNLPTYAGVGACGLRSGSDGITPDKTDDVAATCRVVTQYLASCWWSVFGSDPQAMMDHPYPRP